MTSWQALLEQTPWADLADAHGPSSGALQALTWLTVREEAPYAADTLRDLVLADGLLYPATAPAMRVVAWMVASGASKAQGAAMQLLLDYAAAVREPWSTEHLGDEGVAVRLEAEAALADAADVLLESAIYLHDPIAAAVVRLQILSVDLQRPVGSRLVALSASAMPEARREALVHLARTGGVDARKAWEASDQADPFTGMRSYDATVTRFHMAFAAVTYRASGSDPDLLVEALVEGWPDAVDDIARNAVYDQPAEELAGADPDIAVATFTRLLESPTAMKDALRGLLRVIEVDRLTTPHVVETLQEWATRTPDRLSAVRTLITLPTSVGGPATTELLARMAGELEDAARVDADGEHPRDLRVAAATRLLQHGPEHADAATRLVLEATEDLDWAQRMQVRLGRGLRDPGPRLAEVGLPHTPELEERIRRIDADQWDGLLDAWSGVTVGPSAEEVAAELERDPPGLWALEAARSLYDRPPPRVVEIAAAPLGRHYPARVAQVLACEIAGSVAPEQCWESLLAVIETGEAPLGSAAEVALALLHAAPASTREQWATRLDHALVDVIRHRLAVSARGYFDARAEAALAHIALHGAWRLPPDEGVRVVLEAVPDVRRTQTALMVASAIAAQSEPVRVSLRTAFDTMLSGRARCAAYDGPDDDAYVVALVRDWLDRH